jgi:iron complex outermembrane recepter protein
MALEFVSRAALLGGVAGLAFFATSHPVLAQSVPEPTTEIEEVVVTGLRSVNGARRDVRAASVATVDAITADDIDRLPDRSLAEALDRVVGVSSDRGFNGSQSRFVTLRGFDSRYNSITVDGNPVWNSSRNNRGVQIDLYPSSVVNQTLVYKTVTPDLDANSIGGHIALRTLRAFDGGTRPYFRGRASVGTYAQDSVSGDGEPSYRLDGVGKMTFGENDNFGLVLGFDLENDTFFDEYNQVTGYVTVAGADSPNGSLFRGLFQKSNERASVYGKLEARIEDRLYAFASASWFQLNEAETWYRGGLFLSPTQITQRTGDSGTFANATSETYIESYDLDRETLSLGTGVDLRVGALGSLLLRAAYTRNTHSELLSRGERFQLSGLSGTYDITASDPSVTLNPNANTGLATAWRHRTGRDAFERLIPHDDDVYSLSADYVLNQHQGARGWGFRVGAMGRRFARVFDENTRNYRLPAGQIVTLADVGQAGVAAPTGVDPYLIDRDLYWTLIRARGTFSQVQSETSDYDLQEDTLAGHVAATYATDRLNLLAGVRVESTAYENRTANTQGIAIVPVTREFDYTEVLPNAQAQYRLTDALMLRAAVTRTMARPDFADFAFGQRVTFDINGAPVVDGTNPNLEPRTAWNYDLGAEYSFRNGHITLAVFQKDLENETFRQRRETRNAAGIITLTETIPLNTGSAGVTGLEIDGVLRPFEGGAPWLEGLELAANYTLLDGEWNVVFTDGSTRTVGGLRNQPEWLGNLRLTYGLGRLETTLAWRLRGRTFTGSFGTTPAADIWIDDYSKLDLQANYEIADGIRLTAEVRNLTDEFWIEQTGIDSDALSVAVNPGRSYWFGVRFKY